MLLWLPWKKQVQVSGKVVDRATAQPVAQARVIVTLVCNGFPYESYYGYGLATGVDGTFSLESVAPQRYNYFFVEASAPNDEYDCVTPDGQHVILRTDLLPTYHGSSPRLHYDNFGGVARFGKSRHLIFVGEGW